MSPHHATVMMAHKFCGTLGLTLVLSAGLHGAEVIPPRPAHYFNDYAGIIPPAVAGQLDRQLEQFERDTTNQMLVVVYPRMESKSSVADYAVRVAQAWGVGQKGKDNGAVLFVFMQERQLYIQVGYGLEGALPDGLCHLIVANELQPRFRSGDYAGGLQSAVNAMLAAARGEYRGTGRTHAEARLDLGWPVGVAFLLLISVFAYLNRYWRSAVYQSSGGRRSSWGAPTIWLGGSGFGGGGFGGGGGGGFSAGGGGFGGGGAGGGW